MAHKNQKIEYRLNEALENYFSQVSDLPVHMQSGAKISYHRFFSEKLLIIYAIKHGLPYQMFDLIQEYAPLPESYWPKYLDLSEKTLQRYRADTHFRFKPIHSEKIIEVAEVTNLGLDVFGDQDRFRLWLNTPNFALGNIAPCELLYDSYGKELVVGELIRVSHGILV